VNAEQPRRIDKPWGYELLFAHTPFYAGKLLHIEPGEALSLQYHEMKEETIFVLKGEVVIDMKDDTGLQTLNLKEREGVHIPPGRIHRFRTETGCDLVEVSTPHLNDVVRLEDRYGRIP
jgi:mannose-6-phosphate isomerase-like protein (cupin superfamily)